MLSGTALIGGLVQWHLPPDIMRTYLVASAVLTSGTLISDMLSLYSQYRCGVVYPHIWAFITPEIFHGNHTNV